MLLKSKLCYLHESLSNLSCAHLDDDPDNALTRHDDDSSGALLCGHPDPIPRTRGTVMNYLCTLDVAQICVVKVYRRQLETLCVHSDVAQICVVKVYRRQLNTICVHLDVAQICVVKETIIHRQQ